MEQWRELLVREARGDFGKEGLGVNLQWFVDNWQTVRGLRTGVIMLARPIGLPTSYDCGLGLRKLIERAVGDSNLGNINPDITQERFLLKGTGIRTVNLRVEPYLNGETCEQAAQRLVPAGHTLANTGDLAGFQHDHPKEVEKWAWVLAISEDSRWSRPVDDVLVPYAFVRGASRFFGLDNFRYELDSRSGVLVASKPACR